MTIVDLDLVDVAIDIAVHVDVAVDVAVLLVELVLVAVVEIRALVEHALVQGRFGLQVTVGFGERRIVDVLVDDRFLGLAGSGGGPEGGDRQADHP